MLISITACSGSATRNDVRYAPAPQQSLDVGHGTVSVSMDLYWEEGGQPVDQAENMPRNFRAGINSYLKRYSRDWKVVNTPQETSVSFTCDRISMGSTNCADMKFNCTVSMGEQNSSFTRILDSYTCMRGGDVKSYEAEVYNHGQEVAQTLVETIAGFNDLEKEISDKRLEIARRSTGTSELNEVIKLFPGTEAAEIAAREVIIREEKARKLADEKARARSKREASAAAILGALKSGEDASALEAFARDYADIKPMADEARKRAAEIRGDPLPDKRLKPASFDLSCYDRRNNLCGDYSFATEEKRRNFKSRCQSMGSQVLSQGCNTSGAIGCSMRSGSTTTTTWAYQIDRSMFARNCQTNQGSVINP